jgi:soluble lytic murein transglycosylase
MKILLHLGIFFGVIAVVLTATFFTLYPLKYKDNIKQAATLYDIDPALIASVINAESSFRKTAVSNKGATGLMQVMPSTAEWVAGKMKIDYDENNLTDPETNILIGTFYLNYLLEKFKDHRTAIIAYNAGEGKAANWLADSRYSTTTETGHRVLTTTPYPETNKYVQRVMSSISFYKFRF